MVFQSIVEDGFTQLARLDVNDDAVVDQSDPDFSTLLIWRDDNSDGVSIPEELHPLSRFSISAIHIQATRANTTNAGNQVSHIGTFLVNENGHAERKERGRKERRHPPLSREKSDGCLEFVLNLLLESA